MEAAPHLPSSGCAPPTLLMQDPLMSILRPSFIGMLGLFYEQLNCFQVTYINFNLGRRSVGVILLEELVAVRYPAVHYRLHILHGPRTVGEIPDPVFGDDDVVFQPDPPELSESGQLLGHKEGRHLLRVREKQKKVPEIRVKRVAFEC